MGVIKIAAAGVIGTLLAIQFKNGKTEYGVYISIALSIFIFFHIAGEVGVIVDAFFRIGQKIHMKESYIRTLVKMIGITYVAQFSSSLCIDAGYQTIAKQIEILSKITILVLSMPVILALMETLECFLV